MSPHNHGPDKGTRQFILALVVVLTGVVLGTLFTMQFENRRWHGHGPPLGHEWNPPKPSRPLDTNPAAKLEGQPEPTNGRARSTPVPSQR